jgi:serine/threonine protein kinase
MRLIPGARLGPYEILALVGSGGMGEVYQARDTRLDRHVAIKVLPEAHVADPACRARFERRPAPRDGRLIAIEDLDTAPESIVVVEHWTRELESKRRRRED